MSNDSPALVCKILKLKTGEVIISNIKTHSKTYCLNRPMNVITIPIMDKQGNIKSSNLILKNWIDYSKDEEFVIPKNQVIVVAEPEKDVISYYEETKLEDDLEKAQYELEMEKKAENESKLNDIASNLEKDLKKNKSSKPPSNDKLPSEEDSNNHGHINRFKQYFDEQDNK